ncbi:hypothetical protein GH714_031604 [Hevea brasiliensis]|uniref:BTB domain-containing protein n=1 Tax=Hevea brasiliensis TaxID=3981 RepID=A0A6A6L2I1_HEVBR|nr:hypothetical protein GH714_031604 [Hevea brasiliensis]
MCRPWPGVIILTEKKASGQQPPETLAASASTTSSGFALLGCQVTFNRGGRYDLSSPQVSFDVKKSKASPTNNRARDKPNIVVEREGEEQEPGGHEIEEVHCQISLSDFPGGSETFEMAVKFCYGVKFDLTLPPSPRFAAPENFLR